MCVQAKGLTESELQSVPVAQKSFDIPAGKTLIGRQHQSEVFSALLKKAQSDIPRISRTHMAISVQPPLTPCMTNLSKAPLLVGNHELLHVNESHPFLKNDVVSFVTVEDASGVSCSAPNIILSLQLIPI